MIPSDLPLPMQIELTFRAMDNSMEHHMAYDYVEAILDHGNALLHEIPLTNPEYVAYSRVLNDYGTIITNYRTTNIGTAYYNSLADPLVKSKSLIVDFIKGVGEILKVGKRDLGLVEEKLESFILGKRSVNQRLANQVSSILSTVNLDLTKVLAIVPKVKNELAAAEKVLIDMKNLKPLIDKVNLAASNKKSKNYESELKSSIDDLVKESSRLKVFKDIDTLIQSVAAYNTFLATSSNKTTSAKKPVTTISSPLTTTTSTATSSGPATTAPKASNPVIDILKSAVSIISGSPPPATSVNSTQAFPKTKGSRSRTPNTINDITEDDKTYFANHYQSFLDAGSDITKLGTTTRSTIQKMIDNGVWNILVIDYDTKEAEEQQVKKAASLLTDAAGAVTSFAESASKEEALLKSIGGESDQSLDISIAQVAALRDSIPVLESQFVMMQAKAADAMDGVTGLQSRHEDTVIAAEQLAREHDVELNTDNDAVSSVHESSSEKEEKEEKEGDKEGDEEEEEENASPYYMLMSKDAQGSFTVYYKRDGNNFPVVQGKDVAFPGEDDENVIPISEEEFKNLPTKA